MQLDEENGAGASRSRVTRLFGVGAVPHAVLHGPDDPGRRASEVLIESAYRKCYGGVVSAHFPHLMSLKNSAGDVVAAAGFRWAREEQLFLEQYLDVPVEHAVSRLSGIPRGRAGIVEIGSLATDGSGSSAGLFSALAAHLEAEGATFAVATATRRLRRLFGLVGFETCRIGAAEPARLKGAAEAWGSYYQHDPVIVGGAVGVCAARLRLAAEAPVPEHAK